MISSRLLSTVIWAGLFGAPKELAGSYNCTMSKINQFRELLAESQRAVVFTGAGIGTESGIPVGMEAIEQEFRDTGRVGQCNGCSGIVKSATISFGQQMPEEPMRRALEETLACDLFIVLGSSLTVYPAAGFPGMASENGAKLVIVNQQDTDMDSAADLVIQAGIGDTMTAVLQAGG